MPSLVCGVIMSKCISEKSTYLKCINIWFLWILMGLCRLIFCISPIQPTLRFFTVRYENVAMETAKPTFMSIDHTHAEFEIDWYVPNTSLKNPAYISVIVHGLSVPFVKFLQPTKDPITALVVKIGFENEYLQQNIKNIVGLCLGHGHLFKHSGLFTNRHRNLLTLSLISFGE